jgi:hypothetical protein
MMGYNFADSVAAVIVGFMIVRMGVVFAWEAIPGTDRYRLVGRGSGQHPPGHHRYPRGQEPA